MLGSRPAAGGPGFPREDLECAAWNARPLGSLNIDSWLPLRIMVNVPCTPFLSTQGQWGLRWDGQGFQCLLGAGAKCTGACVKAAGVCSACAALALDSGQLSRPDSLWLLFK